MIGSAFRAFGRNRRGSITVMAALVAPIMIGVAALVLEFGGGLLEKVRLQRVADLAAFAGATAYARDNTASVALAAQMAGRLNGVAASELTAELAPSPKGDGSQVVKVRISVSRRIVLAKVLGFSQDLPVAANAYASLGGGVEPCVIALNGSGAGVKLSGGTSLSATKCSVASNASVAVPCGTTLTAKEVAYAGAAPSAPCGGIKNPSGATLAPKQKTTADPLSGHAAVTAATAGISAAAALASPAAPTAASATDIEFAYQTSTTQGQATALGCTATFASSTWTLTCPNGGTYNFGKVTMGGGISLKVNLTGTVGTKFNFTKGFATSGGSTTTFGPGTFKFGRLTTNCADGVAYSLCHAGSSLTFGGPSAFTFSSGLHTGGGSTLVLGSGTSNSYDIGAASNGSAVVTGGGAQTTFADATSGGGFFRLAGAFNAAGGGGCTILPAAAQHDIKGFMSSAGATVLGAGVYTVNGYIAFGANGGGNATCLGETVGVKGVGVTLVTAGASSVPSGTCVGKTFCLGGGYSQVVLTAPTSGATAKLAIVGPISGVAGGALMAEGSALTASGVFYYPKGAISLSGGASVGAGSGDCLQIIGTEITLAGGTTAASNCISGSSSSGAVALVQ